MNCLQAQQEIAGTEHLNKMPQLQPLIAEHVASCADCQKYLDRLVKIEVMAGMLPPASEASPSEAFLQELEQSYSSQTSRIVQSERKSRFHWHTRKLATAAIVLLSILATLSILLQQQSTARGATILNDMVEWNLQISQCRNIIDRLKVYRDRLAQFRSQVTTLQSGEQVIAMELISNAESLAGQENALEDAQHFASMADRLLVYRNEQQDKAAYQMISSMTNALISRGVVAKLEGIDRRTLSPADATRWQSISDSASRVKTILQGNTSEQQNSQKTPVQLNMMPAGHHGSTALKSPPAQYSEQQQTRPAIYDVIATPVARFLIPVGESNTLASIVSRRIERAALNNAPVTNVVDPHIYSRRPESRIEITNNAQLAHGGELPPPMGPPDHGPFQKDFMRMPPPMGSPGHGIRLALAQMPSDSTAVEIWFEKQLAKTKEKIAVDDGNLGVIPPEILGVVAGLDIPEVPITKDQLFVLCDTYSLDDLANMSNPLLTSDHAGYASAAKIYIQSIGAVPEPSTLIFLSAGVIILVSWKNRSYSRWQRSGKY